MPRSELVCDGPVLDPLPAPDFCISASGLARTALRHPRYQRLGIGYRQQASLCSTFSLAHGSKMFGSLDISIFTHAYAASADTPGTYPFVDSQAGKPCYQICHGRSLTTTRIVVMMFFSQKNNALLSKERNSVTSNLATRDICSTICIVASSYCGLHKPSDTYNAGNSYRSDSPTQVVFHFLSHPLSAVLLYRATSWCTFFGIS